MKVGDSSTRAPGSLSEGHSGASRWASSQLATSSTTKPNENAPADWPPGRIGAG
jgi:hypothetical protein